MFALWREWSVHDGGCADDMPDKKKAIFLPLRPLSHSLKSEFGARKACTRVCDVLTRISGLSQGEYNNKILFRRRTPDLRPVHV